LPALKGTNSYKNVLRHMLKSSQKYANGLLKKIPHTSASIFFQFLVGSFLILFNMLFVNYVEKKICQKKIPTNILILITTRYSWNIAKVGIKHQSINLILITLFI